MKFIISRQLPFVFRRRVLSSNLLYGKISPDSSDIDVESDSCLRVIIDPLDYLFVRKGTLAVNTRNYNNKCFPLYEAPDAMSRLVFQSHVQQTVIVYGICDGWLFVEAQDEYQQLVRGWLPPNMQCGNPYTTCG